MLTKISLHRLSLLRILRSLMTQVNFLPEASISLRKTSPWVPEPSYLILLIRRLVENSDANGLPSGPKTYAFLLRSRRPSIFYEMSISGICSLKA